MTVIMEFLFIYFYFLFFLAYRVPCLTMHPINIQATSRTAGAKGMPLEHQFPALCLSRWDGIAAAYTLVSVGIATARLLSVS